MVLKTSLDNPTTADIIYIDREFFPTFPAMILRIDGVLYMDLVSASNYPNYSKSNLIRRFYHDCKFIYWYNVIFPKKYYWPKMNMVLVSWVGSIFAMNMAEKLSTWECSVIELLKETNNDSKLWEDYHISDLLELFYNIHYENHTLENCLSYADIMDIKLANTTVYETSPERNHLIYRIIEKIWNWKFKDSIECVKQILGSYV